MKKTIKFNNKVLKAANSDGILKAFSYTLPPMTLRFRFVKSDVDPSGLTSKGTWTKVQNVEENLWDWTYDNPNWSAAFWKVFSKENGFSEENYVEIIDAGDTSKVTKLTGFFNGYNGTDANITNYLKNICLFNTQNVTDTQTIFQNCQLLKTIPLYNTSKATNLSYMFNSCYNLITIPLLDTCNCTTMKYMFYKCYQMTSVPFFDTSNVTTMYLMFSFCTNLKTIPQFNTSKCTDFYGMLNAMPLLESIPKLDYSNAKTMQIFIGTNNEAYWPLKLESLPDISTLTTKLTNCASAFKNARNVKYGILDAYNKLVSCNPTTYTDCFLNCGINTEEGRAQLEQIPASWGGLAT